MNIAEILTASLVLFAVIDIIGSIPLILDLKKKTGKVNSEKASLVSLLIMVAFLILGERIITLIGIDVNSFAVAGSFVLLVLALEMILGVEIFKHEPDLSPDIASIVPLAFPLIAGAGTMTTLISLRAEYEMVNILIAILINILLVYLVLRSTKWLERLLGPGGIAILKKVFGIIILAIAVKLFSSNAKSLFI
ncbi:MAG: MarC family protein [Flavobacteriales bacterium]|nr:MarC family protein [Flavobacteriales bacterium]